jgi:hypothetical protein
MDYTRNDVSWRTASSDDSSEHRFVTSVLHVVRFQETSNTGLENQTHVAIWGGISPG